MESYLAERLNMKVTTDAGDFDTPATGARVSMKGAQRISFAVFMNTSTAAVASFSLLQHNAASAGTSKVLSVANPYYYKAGASTAFTKVEPASAADTFVLSTTFAAAKGIVIFEVLAEDLDVNNGFAWVSLNVADTTAAKIGTVVAMVKPKVLPGYLQDI